MCSPRYSSHSNCSVTPRRFSSLWTWFQSGSARAGFASNDAGVNRRRSNSASSIPSGTGQVMPTTPARRRYSATVDRLTPTDIAIQPLAQAERVLQSQGFADLPHRRSLGGHRTSLASAQRRPRAAIRSPAARASGPPQLGGRIRSEQVADFRRNGWPDCVGISGRLGSDYARSSSRRRHGGISNRRMGALA